MARLLTIVGLLLTTALVLPVFFTVTAPPFRSIDFSERCCCTSCDSMPPVACGCRTCPVAAPGVPLIADFSKVPLALPAVQSISWKSTALRAEARFPKPPTPPPRILA